MAVCLLSALSACKGEDVAPTAPAPSPKVHAVKQGQQSSAKAVAPHETFDFTSKRDPFKPHVVEVKADPRLARAKGFLPIQNFELHQFRVAGIIVGLTENLAQVIDPAGKAYTLKKGMVIGNRDGRVSAITPTYIEVVERVTEDSGRTRSQTERLMIPKKN